MGTPTRLSVAATAAILAACATPYKQTSVFNQGGYSEQRRAPGVYAVWFRGNEYSTADRTEALALLRAAELCLDETKPFMRTGDFQSDIAVSVVTPGFSVMKSEVISSVTGQPNPSPVPTTVGYTPGRALYTKWSGLTVECFAESSADVQQAALVAASIRARYSITARSASRTPGR